jgi:MOSC domain-containing protein YiiM
VGTAELEVAQPRQPCFKLGIRMGDDAFPGRFAEAGRPGAYLRIVTPGDVGAGDAIEVRAADEPAIPLSALVVDPIGDDVLRRAVVDRRVPEGWRRAAARALNR